MVEPVVRAKPIVKQAEAIRDDIGCSQSRLSYVEGTSWTTKEDAMNIEFGSYAAGFRMAECLYRSLLCIDIHKYLTNPHCTTPNLYFRSF